ncbi:MAG: UDP-N-acetylmuramoyl-L-alanyl-D-glutamate--2,6-diaminopimelate ligase, partial [Proteobacteria bacterium]|nr:UDP-N-acetylmuramoyl-L-alanyl-D-glutamate--2,6-diaminopimelate ligase [Pseudomonadota bacterium]
KLALSYLGASYSVELPLIGDFQASNALVAAALVIATGGNPETTLAGLSRLKPVRGRMEHAGTLANGASVYVDYAHTPDALRTLLETLRPYTSGKLHVVFGCGGDRDIGKRPMMGAVAADLADEIIVTDDNPRTEDAATIRKAVLAACPSATEIADRGAAISAAVAVLAPGDVLAVAGKGHEQGQILASETIPFDDLRQAKTAIARVGGRHD